MLACLLVSGFVVSVLAVLAVASWKACPATDEGLQGMLFVITDDDYENDFFVDAETYADAVNAWREHVADTEDLIGPDVVAEPDEVLVLSREPIIRA